MTIQNLFIVNAYTVCTFQLSKSLVHIFSVLECNL